MAVLRDRVPGQPGRRKIIPENGTPYYAKIEMADEPLDEGTPLNKKNIIDTINAQLIKKKEVKLTTGSSWEVPADVYFIDVMLVGGGGGGGSGLSYISGGYGGGGGAGGYINVQRNYPVVPGTKISYTIGAGGEGGSDAPYDKGASSNIYRGKDGGRTTFGSLFAEGGKGGNLGQTHSTDPVEGGGNGGKSGETGALYSTVCPDFPFYGPKDTILFTNIKYANGGSGGNLSSNATTVSGVNGAGYGGKGCVCPEVEVDGSEGAGGSATQYGAGGGGGGGIHGLNSDYISPGGKGKSGIIIIQYAEVSEK